MTLEPVPRRFRRGTVNYYIKTEHCFPKTGLFQKKISTLKWNIQWIAAKSFGFQV